MAPSSESSIKRIQVGMIGLVAVLLFVTVSSMLFDRLFRTEGTASNGTAQLSKTNADGSLRRDEPLAELGVAPTVTDQTKAAPTAKNGMDGQ